MRAALGAALVAALASAPPAWGTFPGKPGLIAFDDQNSIQVVAPSGRGGIERIMAGVDPAFSPDGRWIAFVSSGGRKLFIARDDGSRSRIVYESDSLSEPCFSADGSRLFFTKDTSGQGYADIYAVEVEGGEPERLTMTGVRGSEIDSHDPQAAANGRFIVYQRSDSIWTMRPDGSNQKRLVEHAVAPTISPDSRRVVFARGDHLISIGAGGGRERVLSLFSFTPKSEELSRSAAWPAFSPDGRAIAFVFKRTTSYGPGLNSSKRLAVYNLESGKLQILAGPNFGAGRPDWQPR